MTWTGIHSIEEYPQPLIKTVRSRDKTEEMMDLRHNDVFAPEPVIWVRVVEIHSRDRDRGVRADVFHCRNFRFSLESRHKPAGNTRYDDTAIA